MQQQPFEKLGRNSLVLGIAIGVGVSILVGNLMLSAMHATKLDALTGELEVVSQRMQSLAEENAALKGELKRVSIEHRQVAMTPARQGPTEVRRKVAAEDKKAQALAQLLAAETESGPWLDLVSIDDLIVSRVSQQWQRPPTVRNGISVEVIFQARPDGVITGASISRSSGDPTFDQSAVDALRRVGRIPELGQLDRAVFDRLYAQRRMIFKPESLSR